MFMYSKIRLFAIVLLAAELSGLNSLPLGRMIITFCYYGIVLLATELMKMPVDQVCSSIDQPQNEQVGTANRVNRYAEH